MNESSHKLIRLAGLGLCVWLMFFLAACSEPAAVGDQSIQSTIIALRVQQTSVALTQAALAQTAAAPPPVDLPSVTPTPAAPLPTAGVEPPATPASLPEPDDRQLKSATILLFEDMSASRYTRLVKKALDDAGYFYVDVGSAKGWFKTQLLSNQDWDLVIAAAEAERDFGGELFQYVDDRLLAGSSVVLETWDLDMLAGGQARTLLEHCGVQVEADWYEPDLRVFFWLQPGNPLFEWPNKLSSIRNAEPIWPQDAGDLLEVPRLQNQQGAAQLLAGTNPSWKTDHGLLAQCANGRMILQTFRSHDFDQNDMVRLWQNYVYHALKNRFARTGYNPPTPAATAAPGPQPSPVIPGPTPGPEYIFDHNCGGFIAAHLSSSPLVQPTLFEHNANGVFQLYNLMLENRSTFPIQIWDGDYRLEGVLDGKPVSYGIDRDATGYLYLEGPGRLVQGLIQPGESWPTRLAFDVDPRGAGWTLVVRPGSEFGQQVCEVRIPAGR